jgi:Leu/Phe-tRNA-protein transferase
MSMGAVEISREQYLSRLTEAAPRDLDFSRLMLDWRD